MEDLKILYSIPQKVKFTAFISGGFLFALSAGLIVNQIIAGKTDFVFYAGILGAILAAVLMLIVTVWQSDVIIEIDNEEFRIKLPKQRIDGSILWESVSQIGIGVSFLTLATNEKNYKLDFGNLKYNDIKQIKTKLIEICESKSIPYSNS